MQHDSSCKHSERFQCNEQVRQQPMGTYTSQEHFVRMLPVFLVPASAYALYMALSWVLRWVEIRDRARLTGLQAKLKKMVNELKVSHFQPSRKL